MSLSTVHHVIHDMPTPPRQELAVFITFFFPALAWTAFLARIWSRLRITRSWGWGKSNRTHIVILSNVPQMIGSWCPLHYALSSSLLSSICVRTRKSAGDAHSDKCIDIKLGYFGWHQEDVPKDYDPSPGLFYFYIAQLFYNPILALVKCSILVFILHIGRTRKGLPWMVYSVLTLTVLHAVSVFFVVLLSCVPIAAIWDTSLKPHAGCIDNSFHVIISSITVLTDIMVLALPFYVFLGLQMRRRTQIAVLCCFAFGAV
jgi:hypothetical protein